MSVPASLEVQINRAETNLLQGPALAKPIPELDPEVQKMVAAVMALAPRHDIIKCALKQYLVSDRPLNEIPKEHSYTAPALV